MIKVKFTGALLLASLLVSGCVHRSNTSIGKQFTSAQVEQVIKKVTSKADLVRIFGEPSFKSVLTEDSEKWVYSYTGGTTSVESFTMKIDSDISTHTLDILIKNDVVINFAETNTKLNMDINKAQ